MIRFPLVAFALVVAVAPAHAQTSAQRIASLQAQDVALRGKIGQLQLDALVERIDRDFAGRAASRTLKARADAAAEQRAINLYSY